MNSRFTYVAVLVIAMLVLPVAAHNASSQEDDAASLADVTADQWAGTLLAPKAFRVAVDKIAPSLVTIESFVGIGELTQGRIGGISKQGEGNSTGVVISEDGYIITSTFNFIRKQQTITVITNDGVRRHADIVGRDHTRKLCVLKITKDIEGLVVPEMVPLDEIKIGQWAVSVGVGYGDSNPAISAGIVSAKNRIGGRAIQTDANTSPANYGGPLVDIEGRVLGICVPLSPNSQELAAGVEWYDSGIGFAVPLSGADNLIARLKSGKDIRSAWLGIQAKAAEEGKTGISVEQVQKNSPADKAGIKKGDVIIKLDDKPTENLPALKKVLQRFSDEDTTKVTVDRDGEEIDLDVTFSARPGDGAADGVEQKEPESKKPDEEKSEEDEKGEQDDDKSEDAKPDKEQPANDEPANDEAEEGGTKKDAEAKE